MILFMYGLLTFLFGLTFLWLNIQQWTKTGAGIHFFGSIGSGICVIVGICHMMDAVKAGAL